MQKHKTKILWSAESVDDLNAIWDYYVLVAGMHTAENIIYDIYKTSSFLREYPLGGRVREEIYKGLRSVSVSPHVVFYRIKDCNVEIVRVLDGRMDIGVLL